MLQSGADQLFFTHFKYRIVVCVCVCVCAVLIGLVHTTQVYKYFH